jgi:CRISPR system Cascade subunit CasC
LKRAVRTSDEFTRNVEQQVGQRTQLLGTRIAKALQDDGTDEATAQAVARNVAGAFGKLKSEKDDHPTEIEQVAFIAPEEKRAAFDLARRVVAENLSDDDTKDAAKALIRNAVNATDIALFGRMFADRPEMRLTAAAEVAHPFTVDRTDTEVDYYVAVDDLNNREEDAGSAFISEQGFLTGLFYGYATVNKDLLIENLGGDRALADKALAAFIRGLATVAPIGKKSSFGTRARASYLRVERGAATPRSLAAAFLSPVAPREGRDRETMLSAAIGALKGTADNFDNAYDDKVPFAELNVETGEGTLADAIALSQGGPAEG